MQQNQSIDSSEHAGMTESAWSRLKADLRRARSLTSGTRFKKSIELFFAPGIRAMVIFRFGEWLHASPRFRRRLMYPLYFFFHRRMSRIWGITLEEGADIGGGFMIWHHGGIFVGSGARIGHNVGISHDVTIGAGGKGVYRGMPGIGNNVYVSPGVVIAGKITVGSNVKIAPNCVIDKNIPDNCFVHWDQPRVIRFSGFEHEESVPLQDAPLYHVPGIEEQQEPVIGEDS